MRDTIKTITLFAVAVLKALQEAIEFAKRDPDLADAEVIRLGWKVRR